MSTGACLFMKDRLRTCRKRVIEINPSNLVLNLGWYADYDAWLGTFLILQIYCFKSTALPHDSIIQSISLGCFLPQNIWRYENLAWPIYFDLGKQLYLAANVCHAEGSYITLWMRRRARRVKLTTWLIINPNKQSADATHVVAHLSVSESQKLSTNIPNKNTPVKVVFLKLQSRMSLTLDALCKPPPQKKKTQGERTL